MKNGAYSFKKNIWICYYFNKKLYLCPKNTAMVICVLNMLLATTELCVV